MRISVTENRAGGVPLALMRGVLLASTVITSFGLTQSAFAQAQGTVELQAIDVEGQAASEEKGTGPVKGYVAKTSTTATKADKPLIKTPQSVTVVSRAQMDDQSVQSVGQAVAYSAGVLGETRMSAGRYDSVFIRGFGGAGTSAGYVNFLDGLRVQRGINYLVPAIEPYGLERVEILRGPASVLFGQVQPGGIVNQVSKRPRPENFGEIQLQAGTYDRIQAAFDIGGVANEEETVFFRVVGLGRKADTQVDFTKEERVFIAPSVTFLPTVDTTVTLYASYQNEPETGFYGFLPARGTVLPNPNGRLPTNFFPGEPDFEGFSRENLSAGYEIEHRFNDIFTARQKLRVSDLSSEVNTVAGASLAADGRTLSRRALTSIEEATTLSLDNHVQADFETGALAHTVLAGVDLQWMDGTSDLNTRTVGIAPIDIYNPVYGSPILRPDLILEEQEQTQLGVYLQDQVEVGGWNLLGGVRVDHVQSDYSRLTTVINSEETAVTGRAAAMYNFDNGFAPYVSFSTSFDPVAGADRAGNPFEPTRGRQYEVGLKYQPVGYNALIQASVYDLTQENVLTPEDGYPTFRVQTGEVRSRGFELEGRANLFEGFDVIASYSYTDVEVTESNTAAEVGKRPPVVPEHQASLWGHYRFLDGNFAGLGLGAGVRFVGEGAGDAANTFFIPSYTLVDAVASYELGARHPDLEGWKVQVNVRNLLDEEYVSGCYGSLQCNYGLRRSVLGTLSYKW